MHKESAESLILREETAADIPAIARLTVEAFRDLAVSSHTEHHIIAALRRAGALTLSLVAERDGEVVGHIALSPLTLSDGTRGWYGLGPLSVAPPLQRQGIGAALLRESLRRLTAMGGKGCCLVGHPEYYRRFGFANVAGLSLPGVPPEVFFALSLAGPMPQGEVAFHPGFHATGD